MANQIWAAVKQIREINQKRRAIYKAQDVIFGELRMVEEPLFQCSNCGRLNNFDNSARKMNLFGPGGRWVCRDQYNCGPR